MEFGIDVPWLVEFRDIRNELVGRAICTYRYLLIVTLPQAIRNHIVVIPIKALSLKRDAA